MIFRCIGFLLLLSTTLVICCDKFDVRSVTYTSSETVLSTKTVVLVEGDAKCVDKGSQNLHAELNGVFQPVSRNIETDTFQVTFVFKHEELPKGNYVVRFYNDEGSAAYLRLLKGGSGSSVSPVFTVDVRHNGLWPKPIVHSETVALITVLCITLGAVYTKNKCF